MAAAGMSVNGNNANYGQYNHGAVAIDMTTTDFTVCGWMRLDGFGTGNRGHFGFGIINAAFTADVTMTDETYDSTSPFDLRSCDHYGALDRVAVATPATGEDWFYAIVWDHTAGRFIYYGAIDGTTSLTGVNGATGRTASDLSIVQVLRPTSNNESQQLTVRNVGVFASALSAAQLRTQMTTDGPAFTAFAYWPMANSTDTSDSSGNGRTLTLNGTITSGNMDPVDLQGGAPSPIWVSWT